MRVKKTVDGNWTTFERGEMWVSVWQHDSIMSLETTSVIPLTPFELRSLAACLTAAAKFMEKQKPGL